MKRYAALFVVLSLFLLFGCVPDIIDPVPNPTPTPGAILFFDDFKDGADQAWGFASGDWQTTDGILHLVESSSGASAFVTSGMNWQDYIAEVDVSNVDGFYLGTRVGIICRAADDRNKIVFWIHGGDAYFEIYEDGVMVEKLGASSGSAPSTYTLAISVVGNTYTGLVNGIVRSEITDNRFGQGTAGIAGRLLRNADFDDFRVTAFD